MRINHPTTIGLLSGLAGCIIGISATNLYTHRQLDIVHGIYHRSQATSNLFALRKIRSGDTDLAIRFLETNLDGNVLVLDRSSKKADAYGPLAKETLAEIKNYREQNPPPQPGNAQTRLEAVKILASVSK